MGTAGRWRGLAGQQGHENVTGLVLLWSGQAFPENQKIQPWLPGGAQVVDAGEQPNPRLWHQALEVVRGTVHSLSSFFPLWLAMIGKESKYSCICQKLFLG